MKTTAEEFGYGAGPEHACPKCHEPNRDCVCNSETFYLLIGEYDPEQITEDDCSIVPYFKAHDLAEACKFAEAYYNYITAGIESGPNCAWANSFWCHVVTTDNVSDALEQARADEALPPSPGP